MTDNIIKYKDINLIKQLTIESHILCKGCYFDKLGFYAYKDFPVMCREFSEELKVPTDFIFTEHKEQ